MKITRLSPVSLVENVMNIDVTSAQISAWRSGSHIQDVMGNLTDNEREFMISGCTPEDWKFLFGDENQEEL